MNISECPHCHGLIDNSDSLFEVKCSFCNNTFKDMTVLGTDNWRTLNFKNYIFAFHILWAYLLYRTLDNLALDSGLDAAVLPIIITGILFTAISTLQFKSKTDVAHSSTGGSVLVFFFCFSSLMFWIASQLGVTLIYRKDKILALVCFFIFYLSWISANSMFTWLFARLSRHIVKFKYLD